MRTILLVLLSLNLATYAQDAKIEEVGKTPVEAKFPPVAGFEWISAPAESSSSDGSTAVARFLPPGA